MDQQGSYIGVALAADAPQFAVIAAAEFAWGHAQPSTELATIAKPFGLTNVSFKRTGGEYADAAYLIQFVHDGVLLMPALELLFALGHALFGQVDL